MSVVMMKPQSKAVIKPKDVAVFGSTGSIGEHTLAIIRSKPRRYRVHILTAQNNVEKLTAQALEFRPKHVVIGNEDHYFALKQALAGTDIEVAAGQQAIVDAAARATDIMVQGIVGAAGLAPTLAAIRRGTTIALANKETLVCAGELIRAEVMKHQATLLPVDSEHNAIFQVFDFEQPELIDRIILTASGGPFRQFSSEQMRTVTPQQAVKHPNWNMGAKISVDSATMMNKGLEMLEAYQLFPLKANQIDVIVHPESIIHSMVEYRDGSILAQMGPSDMTVPIAYAMAWPLRIRTDIPRLNLTEIAVLHFEAPDESRFPSIRLAREVMTAQGVTPIIFNAANEVAVDAFLRGALGFTDIVPLVERVIDRSQAESLANSNLDEILTTDAWARRQAQECIA